MRRLPMIIWVPLLLSHAVQAQPPASETEKGKPSAKETSGNGGAVPASASSGPDAAVDAASDSPATGEKPAQAAVIRHVPQNELETGEGELAFTMEHPELAGSVLVRYRSQGIVGGEVQQVQARRSLEGYVARLPADDVQPPGFVYWAVERMPDRSERPVFADDKHPHPVQVVDPVDMARERDELEARGGDRSRLFLTGEYVDFGSRRVHVGYGPPAPGAPSQPVSRRFDDNYYHLQAGYAFSFFSTVDEIRFNVGRLSGNAATLPDYGEPEQFEPAIYYGESAITWFLLSGLRLRTSLILGISHQGFEGGGGGEIVLGHPDRTNLALGLRGVTTLGITGRVRLGFLAVPRVPMGATVEITDFPVGSDFGVRLLYDVGYELAPGTTVALYGGYQGRTSVLGGFAAGGRVAYAF
jgi:hypothetical protein